MTGVKRQSTNEWYSPYFAPTTVIIAISVLIVSVEAGRLVATPVSYVAPAHRALTKAGAHHVRATTIHATPSKNQP
jgi:hypothetical protein